MRNVHKRVRGLCLAGAALAALATGARPATAAATPIALTG
jgi:hypothetical protein